jgi:hypothetical protein
MQLQTDILIKQFTYHSFGVLHMNDGSDCQLSLSWKGQRYDSTEDLAALERFGFTFHTPIDTGTLALHDCNLDSVTLAALGVVLDQRCVESVDRLSESKRLNEFRSMNVHTMVFFAAARYQIQQHARWGFAGSDLILSVMMSGTNDPDQPEREEIVLPQWFDVEQLQTDILIKQFTHRGFIVLQFNDFSDCLLSVTWKGYPSVEELARWRRFGLKLHTPIDTETPVLSF